MKNQAAILVEKVCGYRRYKRFRSSPWKALKARLHFEDQLIISIMDFVTNVIPENL